MVLWRRLAQLLAVALACAQTTDATRVTNATASNATDVVHHRRLGSAAPGNVAACYTPFHNNEYPLFGGTLNLAALRSAIDDDFRIMSQYFTHVRTYYAQHFGIEIAPIAAKYRLKLYLGAYLTSESWWADEANAAANAIKKYAGTVEVVLTGNENLVGFYQRSWDIINKINDIKARAGSAAGNVKYGTVQRINEFVDPRFDWDMQQLNSNLDILGVNIYPFFTNNYDGNKPAALLDAQWNQVTRRFPRDKIRLTETGFPTAGSASAPAPNVKPGLDASVKYYNGVVDWTPSGYESQPKFWFQAFDRRYGDPAASGLDYELYFGFLTTSKQLKRNGYPRQVTSSERAAALSSPSQSSCPIEEDVDFTARDIGSKPANQAESCFDLCRAYSGCAVFTWSSYSGGTCWFKASKGASIKSSGARSGSLSCSTCSIEEDVDYTGANVGNRQAAQAEDCLAICNGASGCGAYTWTSYNGGTCWLKSSKGSVGKTMGARSGLAGCDPARVAVAQTASSSACSIEENADFSGADVGSKQASRAESCFGLCNNVAGCGAFTWTSYNGGTCWLKAGKSGTKASTGGRSGVACKCNLGGVEIGVDYSGADVGSARGANAEACIALCQAKSGCRAFTWTSYNGGTCWLKANKGVTSANSGANSGVVC